MSLQAQADFLYQLKYSEVYTLNCIKANFINFQKLRFWSETYGKTNDNKYIG